MTKMLSIAALSLFIAAPVFAQDAAKPVVGATPVAPIAAKPDAAKVTAPVTAQVTAPVTVPATAPGAKPADVKAPAAPVTAQTTAPVTAPAAAVVKTGEAPKMDAGKPAAPAAVTAPAMTDKKTEAPKVDVKPMGVGAPKVDDKTIVAPKADAGKTAAPVAATTAPTAKAVEVKPADVKKQ